MFPGSNWVQMPVASNEEQERLYLPPGFRFDPTDVEIIDKYLVNKVANPRLDTIAMGDVDLNKCEPWELPSMAKTKEKELYFFCQKDLKYPTGTRANRATKSGYWKATGKDKEIYSFRTFENVKKRVLVGLKKTLVFYMGRAPKGEKTNWVMHEFRLADDAVGSKIAERDRWVVCRVNEKKAKGNKTNQPAEPETSNSNQRNVMDPSNPSEDQDVMNFITDPTSSSSSDIPESSSFVPSVEVVPSATPMNMPNSSDFSGMTTVFMTESNFLPNNFTSDNQIRISQPWFDSNGYGNLEFTQFQGMTSSMYPLMYDFEGYQQSHHY